jgi:chromosome segregation ATPase
MRRNVSKYIPWSIIAILLVISCYCGYLNYAIGMERDHLAADLDSSQKRNKIIQRKYAEEKAQVATLQRAKLSIEGQVLQAQQELSRAEQENADLNAKIESAEADCNRKTAKLEREVEKTNENIEKLKANRAQYKEKLAEVVQIVKERNQMIQTLSEKNEELNLDLQEKTSTLDRCGTHNARLTVLSEELLNAYEKKGVGDSLLNTEPLTQIKKVEMEHLIQLYRDRIDNDNLELINQTR